MLVDAKFWIDEKNECVERRINFKQLITHVRAPTLMNLMSLDLCLDLWIVEFDLIAERNIQRLSSEGDSVGQCYTLSPSYLPSRGDTAQANFHRGTSARASTIL